MLKMLNKFVIGRCQTSFKLLLVCRWSPTNNSGYADHFPLFWPLCIYNIDHIYWKVRLNFVSPCLCSVILCDLLSVFTMKVLYAKGSYSLYYQNIWMSSIHPLCFFCLIVLNFECCSNPWVIENVMTYDYCFLWPIEAPYSILRAGLNC